MRTFTLVLAGLLLVSCANSSIFGIGKPYDVGLEVSPQTVSLIELNVRVDAVEDPAIQKDEPVAVVTFKVHRVFRGDFSERRGGPSQIEQMKRAARDRNIFKLVTLDFKSPSAVVQRDFVRIAVANPTETFGILSWQNPGHERLRIYLRRDSANPTNYILVDAKHAG